MLEAIALSKRYGNGALAVADLSLTAGRGVLALLGPNGSGKTTLMSMLATVTPPTAGTVRWNGVDACRDPTVIRRTLGYLPQDFGVYGKLTAREFLVYLARLKGLTMRAAKADVARVLELVNLHGAAGRALGTFSGGMRQRVGIAQALLGDPQLVIVDEPTVGLDPAERVGVRNLLAEIAGDRIVILSTHIVGDVEAAASTIGILQHGRLAWIGTPDALVRQSRGRVFSVVTAARDVAALRERVTVSAITQRTDGTHVRFVGDGTAITDAVVVEPTLEDAYLLVARRDAE